MKKKEKEQTENFLALLEQVHIEIKKALKTNRNSVAMELLGQCQDGAIQLGNMLECVETECVETVSILEIYCDFLYHIYDNICNDLFVDAEETYCNLDKLLTEIRNSIEKNIKVYKEAVFLPYHASMWDSLESVWIAANEDPNWNAYVIPIPYYDINSDGSVGKMHYEADLYPDYVPITAYDAFDFSVHRPDIIFIHYPYDDTNYVTSVHPFFYSKNLKQYTEKLVYIPYFVLEEPDLKDETILKGLGHFCKVPGVYHADRVIVQSENMRRLYINVLTNMVGQNTKPYWEEKILGLGSPKFDKLLDVNKKEFDIPNQWKKVLYKADGNRKTVILYNTSVNTICQQGEQVLKKIRNVFRMMKSMQENIALLWRPHPLIQATIQSMCPQLWKNYQEVVERYKLEDWGIYDDSVDLDRAIALCDGYYGDYSSLVQLCQKAGKPIMIQNLQVLDEEIF